MKLLERLFGRGETRVAAGIQQGTGTSWLADIMRLFMGQQTSAGVYMNEDRALTITAVYTAVRIIAGTMAALPLHVYRRTDEGGRELAMKHWAYPLLHDAPNAYHTSYTWRELMVTHLLLWGNSFNRIEWLNNGAAGEVLPLMPWDVEVKLTSRGVKYYQVQLPDGREDLPDDEVLHVPGLSYDGLQGMSVIGKMRDALGLAKAGEDLVGSFFANGAKVGGILEVPGKMDPAAQKNLVDSLQKELAGKDGAFKTIVLEQGAKLHGPNMMPLRDAQFVELSKLKRSEILAEFGVPPHLAGDTEKSTSWGTGIEQMDIGYAKHTITPRCVAIEQEINRKLFRRGSGLYVKHNLDALQRGDFKSLMEGLVLATGRPILAGNEARELLDWNKSKQPDMDKVALPLNTGTGGEVAPAKGDAPKGEGDGVRDVNVSVNLGESKEERAAREQRDLATREVLERIAANAPVVNVDVKPTPVEVKNDIHVPEGQRPMVVVENRVEPAPVTVHNAPLDPT